MLNFELEQHKTSIHNQNSIFLYLSTITLTQGYFNYGLNELAPR